MKDIFFTADLHFGHYNIINLCDRPFETLEEMEETMITKWNNTVDENDVVYVLGDFAFKAGTKRTHDILTRLQGRKRLIIGNHEEDATSGDNLYMWDSYSNYQELRLKRSMHRSLTQDIHIILSHYPMLSWNQKIRGSIQLFGHEHGSLNDKDILHPLQLDVGVDCHNFAPVPLSDVLEIITKQTVKAGI